ncbi:peptide-methionine (S)-S-oxide reductase MsrA [Candidatus Saccharibacteria bacterium]|nr:peptide-methionine (S)-S-oxide reductase MsrA [Candidatus Saccharibacteria bacterium]
MEQAIFAAGCFWGVQYYFDQVPGVTKTTVGYVGGHTDSPSYEDVCTHTTGHAEAVEIEFDPAQVSYETLLKQFFKMHDPTQLNRQGPDVGDSYRTAIFYTTENQNEQAERIKKSAASDFNDPIVTESSKAGVFWPAEDYHQKFAERTGRGICHIPYKAI